MSRGRGDSERAREWRERLARWSASGLSVRAFCAQQGVAEASFYYWKRALRLRDAETPSAAARSSAAARETAVGATVAGATVAGAAVAGSTSTGATGINATATGSTAAGSTMTGPRAEPHPRPKPPLFVPLTVLPAVGPSVAAGTIEVRCPSGHIVLLPVGDLAAPSPLFASLGPLFAALTPPASEARSC